MEILNESFLYKKTIDWSSLNYGVNIPISLQNTFYETLNIQLEKGQSRNIKLIINSKEFTAKLLNIYFDEIKYPNHKDLLQIRYTKNSLIAKELKNIFTESFSYLSAEKIKLPNTRKHIQIPDNIKEYLILYSTDFKDTFVCDCITLNEINTIKKNVYEQDEYELEMLLGSNYEHSEIIEKYKLTKLRKLDKKVGHTLKKIYNFKCQICGEQIGEKYDSNIIHAHHITPFSTSLDNTPQNILIICPNHHAIVHDKNPRFRHDKLLFEYKNGYSEKLLLNYHL